MTYKYAHMFMVADAECEKCEKTTVHSFALVSNNKAFNNAKRVKICETCENITEAPVKE